MRLHVFAHIQADHGVLIGEHHLGQRLGKLGFAYTRGAEEDIAADGPLGILKASACPADGSRDGVNGFILAHHSLVEGFLQAQEFFALILGELLHGDARPGVHHLCNVVFGNHALRAFTVLLPLVLLFLHLVAQSVFFIANGCGPLKILVVDGFLLFLQEGVELILQSLHIRRGDIGFEPHAAGCLVHQIDGLIGQKSV